jgi:hypothetical protein
MSFLNQLSEKLEAQKIYDGMKGKYETRFCVDGQDYALLATTMAGTEDDSTPWMIEFENVTSHRIGMGDSNPKIAKAFGEAVAQWVKERQPHCFYTYGSHIDSIKNIIENVKKKVKGFNLIDDTADKKNDENKEVIEGNPIGKITWTKMLEQEVTTSEKKADTKSEKLEPGYELPKDIKTNKTFLTGTKKDKLDKGDKAYDLKTESVNEKTCDVMGCDNVAEYERHNHKVCEFHADKMDRPGGYTTHFTDGKFIKDESFSEFKAKKDKLIDEGKKLDALKGLAKSALKRFLEKSKDLLKSVVEFAGNEEQLLKWLETNQTDFIHAMDIARHMTDKKQLTFENAVLSGELIQENLLDLIAKKSPKALMAAALVLIVLGSGVKVFGANDSGEDALKKAKENAAKIVDIVKEEGGKMFKEVGKDVEKATDKAADKIGQEAGKAGENIKKGVAKGAEEVGKKIGAGFEKAKEGIKAQMDKPKSEKPIPPPPPRRQIDPRRTA